MLANLAFQTADRAVPFRNPFLALRVDGPFEIDRFAAALALLVQRHGVLRAELDTTTTASMRVRDDLDLPLDLVPRCPDPDALLTVQEWQHFDLGRAPLWRVSVVALGPDAHIISFAFSHLIWDGVSMRTFLSLLAREYAEPGSTGPPGQYIEFVEAARAERASRCGVSWAPSIRTAVADAVRTRQTLEPEMTALDPRCIPFVIGRDAMDRWRQRAPSDGSTPFLRFLEAYLTAAAAQFGRTQLITAFATSRLDLRPTDDTLGYFSDLSLAIASNRPDAGNRSPLCPVAPALSWSEMADLVGPMTCPQELYDVWARGPVFAGVPGLAEVFPGTRTAVLPLTPGHRLPVTDSEQRRVLSGQIVPSLVVDDLLDGTGYLQFNAAALPRRPVRALIERFASDFVDGPKG
ncbi:condensation domain-containing protein [Actinophytocola glycyrrhizae]|uniref:Condensation domain-containing protein n=1 Tax=Actinophytocola glycyrrhizae TaxID=2044873 RepID=A0ABV9SBV0_9PSEU